MKIAILGGGITGLTAAYYLSKNNHEVTVFEKEAGLGGLASGFKADGWEWYLERTYHHLFANDTEILDLIEEIGFDDVLFKRPETASLYEKQNQFLIYPLGSPEDLVIFPLLGFFDKIRAGLTLAFLKLGPFLSLYEEETAKQFLTKTMGKTGWNVLWQELFRKKFGKYAENILASFFWARIKKRTASLGYINGGFQELINYLEKKGLDQRVVFKKNLAVSLLEKRGEIFIIRTDGERPVAVDLIISTLPTPVLVKAGKKLFPKDYLEKLKNINYLHAVTFILETAEPILNKTYWLNICTDKLPLMIVCQHTNYMDKSHYNNHHLAYFGWYIDETSPLLGMTRGDMLKFVLPELKKITKTNPNIINSYLFKAPFAQPIFDKSFLTNRPDFKTPVKNFLIANLDMTYPYDRGTNYAVKLGRDVVRYV